MSGCTDAPEDETISLFAGLLTNPDVPLSQCGSLLCVWMGRERVLSYLCRKSVLWCIVFSFRTTGWMDFWGTWRWILQDVDQRHDHFWHHFVIFLCTKLSLSHILICRYQWLVMCLKDRRVQSWCGGYERSCTGVFFTHSACHLTCMLKNIR
jgi:hypothetical protein